MGEPGKNNMVAALFFIVIMHIYSYQVSTASCIKQERESLLRLKASFIDSSNRLGSWKGIDCCSWNGVSCNQTNGHVVRLDLRNYEYQFSTALFSNGIDSSLFELKYLNHLDLSANFFNHTKIPDYFSSMLELRYLNLSLTYFYGGIPYSLGNLTKLLVLDFNVDKYLYGTDSFEMTKLLVDDLGWISSLSSLEYLDLSGVKLQSNLDLVQVLNKLPSLLSLKVSSCGLQNTPSYMYASLNSSFISKLQHLDLSNNYLFSGPIPNFLQNITSMRFLYLASNGFNSSIPLWLTNLRNLIVLSLKSNLFTSFDGGLASIIRNNCYLKEFDSSYNHFLGGDVFGSHENLTAGCKDYALEKLDLSNIKSETITIPKWLGQFKNLKFLNLQNSSLYGPIPTWFGNLSSLEKLDMSYNMLSGGIPISFGKLLNLEYLQFRDSNLDGIIPESFGQLQSLIGFDFSENAFEGVLSEIHFANLSLLEWIFMEQNSLISFEMKHDWTPPFQLTVFSVRSTKGFGANEIPRWLGTQKEMSYLNLFNTNIVGPIPTWFRFPILSLLDLSYNQITGSLPKNIDDQMPNLNELFMSNAHINGSLPQRSLCRLKHLMLLVLADNTLSGIIPSCLLTPILNILDLSLNNFSGALPSPSQNLSSLEVLKLAKNKLEGDLFDSLRSCKKALFVLDVEGNRFSGNIPAWMGKNFASLQILNLRGNMFNGTIPSTLWLLRHLQILILADNKLEGIIPSNLGNFGAIPGPITDDDLVCNIADDPYALCYVSYVSQVMKSNNFNYSYLQLYSMVNIDLSNNSLHGNIPSGITTVKGLFGLNLSHNNLSGTISMEIGRTVSLQSLDLSFNQLSGLIPSSMSSLDSLGALKLSNNNFSGCIPREGHLSTFNDASSFEGNPCLRGDPLSVKCPNENSREPPAKIESFDDHDSYEGDKYEKMWFFIIVMLGYALGYWGVVGALILKRSWRHAYFQFMD